MTEPTQPTPVINEKDKKFILALAGLGAFLGELGVITILAVKGIPIPDPLVKAAEFTGTIITMAWTWYFSSRNNGTAQ